MIINCGNRRLKSYQYGWRIEIRKQREKKDGSKETVWIEDSPAYPSTLASACEMVAERLLKDKGSVGIEDLEKEARNASQQVRKYLAEARKAA